jgi:hypothetical protein
LEVDVVAQEAGALHLYEIKSGETIRPEYYDNINALKRSQNNISGSTIIYDGESFPPISVNIREI